MKGSIEMGNNNKYKYDEEFKANAVRLVTGGRTVAEVARDLGVSEPALKTPRRKVGAFMRKYGMDSRSTDAPQEIKEFFMEMENGLAGSGSLAMIPTYIGEVESLPPGKPVVVIDAGGTHLRGAVITFDNSGAPQIDDYRTAPMPGVAKALTKDEFLEQLADFIWPLLGKSDIISICFSFGTIPLPDKDGEIYKIGKQLKVSGLIGHRLVHSLKEVLAKRGFKEEKRFVVLNDSVAAILGGMASSGGRKYSDFAGLIVGTGVNICYFEKCANIARLKGNDFGERMIVNTESGNYNKFRRGAIDAEFDSRLMDPGHWLMEKMISGKYQGSLLLETLKTAAADGLMSPHFTAKIKEIGTLEAFEIDKFLQNPYGSGLLAGCCAEDDVAFQDKAVVYYIIDGLFERSAAYLAVNICAVLSKTGAGRNPCLPVCICAEGSTFYNSKMLRAKLDYYLKRYLNDRLHIYHEFVKVENANLIGSAVAGFSA